MLVFYVIVGIIAGLVGANISKDREQNPALWFIVCFLFPIAVIGLLFIEKKEIKKNNNINIVDDLTIYTIPTDNLSFEKIKEQTYDYYLSKGITNIIIDTNKVYLVKSEDKLSFIQLENKNDKFILSIKNTDKPSFLDDILPKEEVSNQDIKDDTAKLIDLANLLEKGLISKEEFQIMKKDIVDKKI